MVFHFKEYIIVVFYTLVLLSRGNKESLG